MFKLVGTTKEFDTCTQCLRSGLKKVVLIQEVENGEIVRFGTPFGVECAAKILGLKDPGAKKTQSDLYTQAVTMDIDKKVKRYSDTMMQLRYCDSWFSYSEDGKQMFLTFSLHGDPTPCAKTEVTDLMNQTPGNIIRIGRERCALEISGLGLVKGWVKELWKRGMR